MRPPKAFGGRDGANNSPRFLGIGITLSCASSAVCPGSPARDFGVSRTTKWRSFFMTVRNL